MTPIQLSAIRRRLQRLAADNCRRSRNTSGIAAYYRARGAERAYRRALALLGGKINGR